MSHLRRELELNSLEALDELQINTVTQQSTQQNSQKPKSTCHQCKRPGHYQNQCRQMKREKEQNEITRIVLKITTLIAVKQTLTPAIKFPTIPTQTLQILRKTEDLDLSTHLVRPVVKLTTPQRSATLEQSQPTHRLPGIDHRKDKTKSNREMPKATQMEMSKLQPKL